MVTSFTLTDSRMSPKEILELWPDEKKCREGYHFRMGVWWHKNGWSQREIVKEENVAFVLKQALAKSDGDVDMALELIKATLIGRSSSG